MRINVLTIILADAKCLIREKVVTFRMVKLNLLLSIFVSLNGLRIFNFITINCMSQMV